MLCDSQMPLLNTKLVQLLTVKHQGVKHQAEVVRAGFFGSVLVSSIRTLSVQKFLF